MTGDESANCLNTLAREEEQTSTLCIRFMDRQSWLIRNLMAWCWGRQRDEPASSDPFWSAPTQVKINMPYLSPYFFTILFQCPFMHFFSGARANFYFSCPPKLWSSVPSHVCGITTRLPFRYKTIHLLFILWRNNAHNSMYHIRCETLNVERFLCDVFREWWTWPTG